jgi:hypothetical protein
MWEILERAEGSQHYGESLTANNPSDPASERDASPSRTAINQRLSQSSAPVGEGVQGSEGLFTPNGRVTLLGGKQSPAYPSSANTIV